MLKTSLFILFLLISFSSRLAQADTITIYAENGYTPFSNEDGSGLVNQRVIDAYALVGVDVKYQVLPFARLKQWLKNGRGLAGFSTVKTPEGTKAFLFGEQPIYHVVTKFFSAKKFPVIINGPQDLNNSQLNVGEVNGYMYHQEYYDYTFIRHHAQSDENLIKMLLLGRIDLAYMTESVVEFHLNSMGLSPDSLIGHNRIGVVKVPLFVAFNKSHPKAQYYADLLDKGLILLSQKNN